MNFQPDAVTIFCHKRVIKPHITSCQMKNVQVFKVYLAHGNGKEFKPITKNQCIHGHGLDPSAPCTHPPFQQ